MKQSELRGLDIEVSPRKMAIARGGSASPAYLQPLSPRIQLAQSQVGREPSSARTFVGLQRAHIDATHPTAKVSTKAGQAHSATTLPIRRSVLD
jgi:hypothetical protein